MKTTFLERLIIIILWIFITLAIPFCLNNWWHLLWSWLIAEGVANYLEGKDV